MKKILLVPLFLLLLLVAAGFVFPGIAGSLLAGGIAKAGTAALGVPLRLSGVSLSLFGGRFSIDDLAIGNPPGFESESCFAVGNVVVGADLRSLLSDEVIVHEVAIRSPEVTCEIGAGGTNFGALLDHLEARRGGSAPPNATAAPAATPQAAPPPPASAERDAGPRKTILVERFLLEDVRVTVKPSALLARELRVVLPRLELKDIGTGAAGGRQPVTLEQLLEHLFGALAYAVADANGVPVDLSKLLAGDVSSLSAAGKTIDAVRAALKDARVEGVEGLGDVPALLQDQDALKDAKKQLESLEGLLGGKDDASKAKDDKNEKKKKKKDKKDEKGENDG
jgi:hypothetical protein